MSNYDLKFKTTESEKGYWHTSIRAETDEEAIEEAKKLISNKEGRYFKPILQKIIYRSKTIWKGE